MITGTNELCKFLWHVTFFNSHLYLYAELFHQRLCYLLSCLCDDACKRSLAVCHKSSALWPVSRLLSWMLIWFKQINKTINDFEGRSCNWHNVTHWIYSMYVLSIIYCRPVTPELYTWVQVSPIPRGPDRMCPKLSGVTSTSPVSWWMTSGWPAVCPANHDRYPLDICWPLQYTQYLWKCYKVKTLTFSVLSNSEFIFWFEHLCKCLC